MFINHYSKYMPLTSLGAFNSILGDDLDKLRAPVSGDQLTRIRLEGAKALRKGAHTSLDSCIPLLLNYFTHFKIFFGGNQFVFIY